MNEIVIHVTAHDDVDAGFASVRVKSRKLGDDVEDDLKQTGPKIGKDLSGGMLGGLTDSLPSFAQFGGVVGVIMAPTLGAAVAAGVMGGAGGAGILGGLALAAKNPMVIAAASDLKKTVGDQLKDAASAFVPVALTSLGKLKAGFSAVLPDIKAIFDKSSTFVDPLLDGIISGAKRIMGPLKNVVDGAGPVFAAFGRTFDQLGASIGQLLQSLADNGKQGASAVDDISDSVSNFIKVTGYAVNGLAEMKGGLDTLDDKIDATRYKLEDHVGWLDLTADGYKKGSEAADLYRQGIIGSSDSANNYTHYLEQQKKATDGVTDSTNNETSAVKDLSDALKAQTDPLFAVVDAESTLSSATAEYNKQVREHGRGSQQAKDADNQLNKAMVGLVSSLGNAAGGTGHLTQQQKNLLSSAGASKDRIKDLDNELYNAWKQAQKLDGFRVDITIAQSYKTFGRPATSISAYDYRGLATGGVSGAASGATSSGATWVGENGPELLDLPPGTAVHTSGDSARMAGGGGGGLSTVVARFDKAGLTGLAAALMETLRLEIQARGGNVQMVLGS